jgi:hypothetical protein
MSKIDTQKKYGFSKTNAIMLFFQMIFVIIGFINACLSVYDGVMSGLGMANVVVAIVDVLAFVAIIHYGIMGFRRKDDLAFISVVYVFTAALLVKQILLYDDVVVKVIVGFAFGISFAFAQRLKDHQYAKACLNIISVLLLIAAVVLSVQLILAHGARATVIPEDEVIQFTPEEIVNMTPEQFAEIQEMVKTGQTQLVKETESSKTTITMKGGEEEELSAMDKFLRDHVGSERNPSAFRKFIMFCAYWSPLLLTLTISLTYHTRLAKSGQLERRKKRA